MGGFIFSQNQIARREDITKEIKDRMNEGYSVRNEIQVTPYVYTIGQGETKVVTRTLAVECAKDDSDSVKNRLMEAFALVSGKWLLSNSRHYKFFPFRATQDIPEEALRS